MTLMIRHVFDHRRRSSPGRSLVLGTLLAAVFVSPLSAQRAVTPRIEQDPERNNLVHPADYQTGPAESLGRVDQVGQGEKTLILIAGAGFGGDVFNAFMEENSERYTMFAVTLPGFGGTPAPPMPPAGTSYGEQTWHRGIRKALERLIESRVEEKPIIVGHWLNASQVALELTLERPDLVRDLVLVSGMPRIIPVGMPAPPTRADRVALVDNMLVPRWFKTVTENTWHDGNFLPRDYALHDLRALQLWRMAARPTLPVWVRYLAEAWALDLTPELDRLEVPTLVLRPGFDEAYFSGPPTAEYMRLYCLESWEGLDGVNERLEIRTFPGSRVFIMEDRPEEFASALEEFVDRH